MKNKFLYIFEYYVPASHSDGGLLCVIADDNEECFDLVVKWDKETWPEYYGKLRENVSKAQRFRLADEVNSHVVETFTV